MADNPISCPFCGGQAKVCGFHVDLLIGTDPHDFCVICDECGASSYHYANSPEKAIAAWNKRADDGFDINALFSERDYYKSVAKHVYRIMQEARELMQYIPRTCSTCYANDMDIREVDNPCWNCKGRGYPNWKWRNADHFREVTEMVDRGRYGSD